MAITSSINWPDSLPCVLRNGYDINHVNPLVRSDLESGRAIQRRRFTSVPSIVQVQWIMTSGQAQLFEAFYRDDLLDGAEWFNFPMLTPIGTGPYVARFTQIYSGPTLQPTATPLWLFKAELELWERPLLPPGFIDDWPAEWLEAMDRFDIAMNQTWPLWPDSGID